MRLGLLVNPIAGMGGAVGLKGSDGEETLARARALGAVPQSPGIALRALNSLRRPVELVTGPGPLGEDVAREAGLTPIVLSMDVLGDRRDSLLLGKLLREEGVDLIAFCGGDGTARDMLEAVGELVPIVGIPAGVKMHSAVFLHRPEEAGELLEAIQSEESALSPREVLDIDEDRYREGFLDVRLHGIVMVPHVRGLIQGGKQGYRGADEQAEAEEVAAECLELMEPGIIYFIGPGGGTMALMDLMDLPGSLLGFDIVLDGQLLADDVNAAMMETLLDEGRDCRAILGIVGGQGFLIGRGNRQLTPSMLEKIGREGLIVLAPPHKTRGLRALRVDSGSEAVDAMLRGYIRVLHMRGRTKMMRLV